MPPGSSDLSQPSGSFSFVSPPENLEVFQTGLRCRCRCCCFSSHHQSIIPDRPYAVTCYPRVLRGSMLTAPCATREHAGASGTRSTASTCPEAQMRGSFDRPRGTWYYMQWLVRDSYSIGRAAECRQADVSTTLEDVYVFQVSRSLWVLVAVFILSRDL